MTCSSFGIYCPKKFNIHLSEAKKKALEQPLYNNSSYSQFKTHFNGTYRQIFQKHNFGTKPSHHKKANEAQNKLFIFL